MVETTPAPDGRAVNPTVHFEPTDARFGPIAFIMLGTIVLAVVIFVSVWVFFYNLRNAQEESKKSPYPMAPGPSTALPREPRLEQVDRLAGNTTPNVNDRETANLKILNSYGTMPEEGYLHVPIDRAMEVLLQQQTLRSRPEPPAEQSRRSSGLVDSGEPNSGRLFKGGPK
jgi:hypothetical protein